MNFILSLLVLLCTLGSALADQHLEPVSLQLKWKHQFQFAGFYAAKKLGYYEKAGFDVTILPRDPSHSVYDDVLAGRATFGVGDASIVVRRLLGEPLVITSTVFQHSPLVFITREEDNIRSPYELVGKKVMFERNADDASLVAMFAALGITEKDYEFVPTEFDDFALINTDVDAMSGYSTDQPFRYQNRGINVRIIDPSNYGIDFYGDLIYTRESYAREYPERAQAFADASLEGWHYAINNPEDVIGWLLNEFQSEKTLAELRYEAETTRTMIAQNFIPLGTLNTQRFNRIADIYRNLGMAPSDSKLGSLFLEDYFKQDQKNTEQLVRLIVLISIALLLLSLFLWAINRRLKNLVQDRTRALDKSNSELKRQLAVIDKYVITSETDPHGIFTKGSTAFCEVAGYSTKEIVGMNASNMRSPDIPADQFADMWQRLLNGQQWSGELKNIHKNGSVYWLHSQIDPIHNNDHEITGYSSISTNITDRKLLERLSETDRLTDLPNRLKLDQVLNEEWHRYKRYGDHFSVVIFDIDLFKSVNDVFGHLEGDRVLQTIADVVRKNVRSTDTVGRWGGEEFLLICPKTDLKEALLVSEKLRTAIEHEHILASRTITASFGVSSTLHSPLDLHKLILMADEALYLSKTKGRNKVTLSEKEPN